MNTNHILLLTILAQQAQISKNQSSKYGADNTTPIGTTKRPKISTYHQIYYPELRTQPIVVVGEPIHVHHSTKSATLNAMNTKNQHAAISKDGAENKLTMSINIRSKVIHRPNAHKNSGSLNQDLKNHISNAINATGLIDRIDDLDSTVTNAENDIVSQAEDQDNSTLHKSTHQNIKIPTSIVSQKMIPFYFSTTKTPSTNNRQPNLDENHLVDIFADNNAVKEPINEKKILKLLVIIQVNSCNTCKAKNDLLEMFTDDLETTRLDV